LFTLPGVVLVAGSLKNWAGRWNLTWQDAVWTAWKPKIIWQLVFGLAVSWSIGLDIINGAEWGS